MGKFNGFICAHYRLSSAFSTSCFSANKKYNRLFDLKAPRHDFSSKLSIFNGLNGILNASSKFKNQILRYKEDTEFEILCL